MAPKSTPLDPETILAHQPFLRELARSLLLDTQDANDAMQHAWLAACERPPREAGTLRAWLAAVVRNFARDGFRRERRRAERERIAARAEALPGVDEFVERETQRQRIVRVVLALPEPYRTAIVWRYFDGLGAAQIAERLGIPASTVRNRIHRGLEQLRARLEAVHGDRMACIAALELLARPAAIPTIPIPLATLGFAVKKTLAAVAAALVLAAAIWTLIPNETPGGARELAALPVQAAGTRADRELARAEAPPATTPARLETESRSKANHRGIAPRFLSGFRGRLVSPDGDAAAKVAVTLIGFDPRRAVVDGLDWSSGATSQAPLSRYTARADAEGRFEILGILPGERHALLAGAGTRNQLSVTLTESPAPGEVLDLGDLRLVKKGKATGKVVDAAGNPVAGAWVRAIRLSVMQMGSLTRALRADLLDPRGRIAVESPAAAPKLGSWKVLDLPTWVEESYLALGVPEAWTAADGSFELLGLESSANMVMASKPGHLAVYRTPVSLGSDLEAPLGVLALKEGETLRGRVVDARGNGVAGAEICVGPTSFEDSCHVHLIQPAGRSGADGRFEARGQAARPAVVAARRGESEPWTVVVAPKVGDGVEVRLPENAALTVALTGAPLPESEIPTIRLYGGAAGGETVGLGLARPVAAQWTRVAPGVYRSSPIPKNTVTVCVASPSVVADFATVDLRETERAELALRPASKLEVEVVDESGEPIAGVSIRAESPNAPDWLKSALPASFPLAHWAMLPAGTARTDADGRARIVGLPHGSVSLVLSHPGFAESEESVSIPTPRLRLTLGARPVLAGRVLVGGQPISERQLLVAVRTRSDSLGLASTRSYFSTDDQGRFVVKHLAPGSYELSRGEALPGGMPLEALDGILASREPYAVKRTPFTLTAGRATEVLHEEELGRAAPGDPSVSVAGEIRINGSPAAGLRVNVIVHEDMRGPGRNAGLVTRTDANGNYRIDGVKLMERRRAYFVVRDPDADVALHSQQIELAAPITTKNLDIAMGEVSGRVIGPDGAGVEAAVSAGGVTLLGGNATYVVRSDAGGRYAIPRLPAGTYDFQTIGPAGDTSNRGVVIAAGKNTVDLRIYPYGTIAGTVDLSRIARGGDTAVWLLLFGPEGPVANNTPRALVGADGTFQFRGVRADTYTAHVFADGKWYWDPKSFELKGEPLAGLTISVVPGDPPEVKLPPMETSQSKAESQQKAFGGGQLSPGWSPVKGGVQQAPASGAK
jgi:RNA polymerase sigma-70 factor (ECF subfamily)